MIAQPRLPAYPGKEGKVGSAGGSFKQNTAPLGKESAAFPIEGRVFS